MHYRAIDAEMKEGTVLEVTFQDGTVKGYDVEVLFGKYPQLMRLKDPELFKTGRLLGFYGIVWDDELDIGTETIYEDGWIVRQLPPLPGVTSGNAVMAARAQRDLSQKELAELSGIDQSDISKIERGVANPTVSTLEKLAKALNGRLVIEIVVESD